jgi:acyl carrier protein phosphodiesterase
MTTPDDLAREIRDIKILARGPDMPLVEPKLKQGSNAWHKQQADEKARLARVAAAAAAEKQAQVEREAAAIAEAERKAANAGRVAKLRHEIRQLEAKRQPITEQIRAAYALLGDLL